MNTPQFSWKLTCAKDDAHKTAEKHGHDIAQLTTGLLTGHTEQLTELN